MTGLFDDDRKALVRKYPFIIKKNLSPYQGDLVIRHLMATGNYEKITVYSANNKLNVHGSRIKRVNDVVVTGYSPFSLGDIENILNIEEDSRFERGKILQAGERIKEFYGKNGYFNAEIEVEFKKLEDDRLDIHVKIEKKDPCIIQKIEVHSDNKVLNKRLENQVKKYTDEPFKKTIIDDIQKDVTEYFLKNRYLKSVLKREKVLYNENKTSAVLIYKIDEPIKYQLTILGNEEGFSTSALYRAIDFKTFNVGSVDPAREITSIIRNKYLEEGYPHVKVTYDEVDDKKGELRKLKIKIDEGFRVKIREIKVSGRISRPSKYYANFIKENSSPLIDDGYYNKNDLDLGFKNLTTELQNQGYIRAKIQSSRISYFNKRTAATIHIVLDEGPLTQLRKISFTGLKALSRLDLINLLELKSNEPLRLNKLEEGIARIKNKYLGMGHLEMRIDNEKSDLVKYDERGASAELKFDIYEGPQITVASIVLKGNDFTKNEVILKEIDFKTGDILTPEKIQESIFRLNKFGIFSSTDIQTLEKNSNTGPRTIIITVKERNPGIMKFGIGVTNKRGITLRGYTGVAYNNLWGRARSMSFRANLQSDVVNSQYLENKVTIGYLEPFLFPGRVRGRINFVRDEEVLEYDSDQQINTIEVSDKLSFLLEKEFTTKVKLSWLFWSIDRVKQFQTPTEEATYTASQLDIATLGPSLELDYRDNPFVPTFGSYTRFNLEYSAPFLGSTNLVEFGRLEGNFTHYYRLFGSPRFLWVNSLRGGYVKNLSTETDSGVPTKHAFFLGGQSTIRGFSGTINDRIPSNAELPTDTGDQLIIEGYSTYKLLKSELRFPIYGILGGALFYDAGEVFVENINFTKPFRQSYGAGIRINTPVGPISLDYGKKIDPIVGEDEDHFHLSIGSF